MRREPAWRVFAGEFNDSTYEIKGIGEKTPSFIISPLGAKINRMFIVGVLTDVENISESGELLRAHISDPTGVFTLYSGQYQQEATDALSNIEAPAFVAVIGKARTYEPEEGTLFVSIRPEKIQEVPIETRDKWILESCRDTKDRVEAMIEGKKMSDLNINELQKLGYSKNLSEGIINAVKNYQDVDLQKYVAMIHESLQYIAPSQDTILNNKIEEKPKKKQKTQKTEVEIKPTIKEEEKTEESTKESDENEETENLVLETIKELEGEEGAPWDAIVKSCEQKKLDTDSIEEALTSLMDKGFIFEPVLGTIKTT